VVPQKTTEKKQQTNKLTIKQTNKQTSKTKENKTTGRWSVERI